jgi:hypothetical protein
MATALTAEQQENVDFYYNEVMRLLRLSEQLTDPTLKQFNKKSADEYPTYLRRMEIPEVIVRALEARLGPRATATAAESPYGPSGGKHKTRKGIKKRRSTRRKFLKNSNRK